MDFELTEGWDNESDMYTDELFDFSDDEDLSDLLEWDVAGLGVINPFGKAEEGGYL